MAWIYLAGSEDSHWPWIPGSDQSVIVKTIDMRKQFCCGTCEMAGCPVRQSGMMCEHSWDLIFPNRSILLREVFRARISVLRDMESAWTASEAAFSSKSFDCVANFDLDSCSWKMSQLSLIEDLTEFSRNSLRFGMTVAGRLFQPPNLEPCIFGKDGLFLPTMTTKDRGHVGHMTSKIPTPTAKQFGNCKGGGSGRIGKVRDGIHRMARKGILPGHPKGLLNQEWTEQAMGYPIGWTEIEDWAMQWFRFKRKKHSAA